MFASQFATIVGGRQVDALKVIVDRTAGGEDTSARDVAVELDGVSLESASYYLRELAKATPPLIRLVDERRVKGAVRKGYIAEVRAVRLLDVARALRKL